MTEPLMLLPDSAQRQRRVRKKGHAAWPGTGPAGETCRSCAHYRSHQSGVRTHPKCFLARAAWTRGPGSDIRAKDPACEKWTIKEDKA